MFQMRTNISVNIKVQKKKTTFSVMQFTVLYIYENDHYSKI